MPQSTVITNFAGAFPGMDPDGSGSNAGDAIITRVSGETTLQIPFGRAVLQSLSADSLATSATSLTNPRLLLGVLQYNAFNQITSQLGNAADTNGNIGLQPQAALRIKKRGRLYVALVVDNVTPNSPVRVAVDATGGGTAAGIGAFRATSSAGHTINVSSFCKWVTTALASGGVGLLDYDFTLSGLATAD